MMCLTYEIQILLPFTTILLNNAISLPQKVPISSNKQDVIQWQLYSDLRVCIQFNSIKCHNLNTDKFLFFQLDKKVSKNINELIVSNYKVLKVSKIVPQSATKLKAHFLSVK